MQLSQLEANLALGVLSIDHNGKKTTFQSATDMLDLRDRIKSELAAAAQGSTPQRGSCMSRPTIFIR